MQHETTHEHRPRPLRFLLHGLEMVIAMAVGMVVLGPIWSWAWPGLSANPTAHVLVMATDMSIGMAVWMRIRGHGLAAIAEMTAAMYIPFLALLPFHWAGMLSGMTLMTVGHLLMLPAMLIAMLRRRHEYGW
jgi:flagellar biosynthetic protein FliP